MHGERQLPRREGVEPDLSEGPRDGREKSRSFRGVLRDESLPGSRISERYVPGLGLRRYPRTRLPPLRLLPFRRLHPLPRGLPGSSRERRGAESGDPDIRDRELRFSGTEDYERSGPRDTKFQLENGIRLSPL